MISSVGLLLYFPLLTQQILDIQNKCHAWCRDKPLLFQILFDIQSCQKVDVPPSSSNSLVVACLEFSYELNCFTLCCAWLLDTFLVSIRICIARWFDFGVTSSLYPLGGFEFLKLVYGILPSLLCIVLAGLILSRPFGLSVRDEFIYACARDSHG
jgi:hypothetical protein